MNKKVFSTIAAIVTSVLWGSAFIAQDLGMDHIGPYTFNSARLFIGSLCLLPFFLIFELKKIKEKKINIKKVSFFLIFLGFLLGFGQALQQVSLLYTDVANSGMFTVMYVLIVPIISLLFFSKKIHWSVWPAVFMSLIGAYLLSELDNLSVRYGDILVILSAFFWAFQIIYIGKTLKIFNFPIAVAFFQCFFATIFSYPPVYFFEDPSLNNILKESYEILYVGIFSSGVAFLLQSYSLQNLSPAPAAIIYSLEGVFAAIFGWVILSQYLSTIKILGIILILSAVIFSQLIPIYDKKKYG